jgi:hypothetical protein
MKKVLSLIVLFAFIASAQVKFGITGGLNFANFYGDDAGGSDSRTGLAIGIFIDNIYDGWGFTPELLYSMKGAKHSDSETSMGGVVTQYEVTAKYDYIELPLLVRYRIPLEGTVKPVFHAGPYLGYLVSSKDKVSITENGNTMDVEVDIKDQKSFDAGLKFGAGVNIGIGNNILGLSIDYSFGLLDLNSDAKVKNSCFSIMAAYSF